MKTTPRSETEAQDAARRALLPSGWHSARFIEAVEKESRTGSDMIEVVLTVADKHGHERRIKDWLTDSTFGAARLRHACEAVGALARYESGEVGQADFPGHDCRVKIGVEKKRGYPERNVIEDYAAASPAIAVLRGAGD